MKLALAVVVVLACCTVAGSAAPDNYLAYLSSALAQEGSHLAGLVRSGQDAATRFIAGGKLWVAGRQEDFIAEACGRAGGLVEMAPLGQQVPEPHDVVLYAVPGQLDSEDRKLISHWQEQGILVVPFTSSAGLYRGRFPADTVVNVLNLWTWTGEFVAACTRLGKMPVLYESYGLPGGRDRAAKYKGKRFHEDLTIQPIAPGVLGREYRDRVQGMLRQIEEKQLPKIARGAQWWREAHSTAVLCIGHMFPRHVQDPRAPSPASAAAVPAWEDKELLETNRPPQCAIYIGYQSAPRRLIAQATTLGVRLIYFDVAPGAPPEPAKNILYLNPCWPPADSCVKVPGYDIPILPASGVVDAAIYWALLSCNDAEENHG